MKCTSCGRDIGPQETGCQYCRQTETEVKVLTPAERENFQGVTLDSETAGEGADRRYRYESQDGRSRIYVRQVSFGGMSIWTKLIILAVTGLVVFVLLPMFFLFIAAIGVVWFILRLLRG